MTRSSRSPIARAAATRAAFYAGMAAMAASDVSRTAVPVDSLKSSIMRANIGKPRSK